MAAELSEGAMKDLFNLRPMYYFSMMLDLPGLGVLDERWRDLVEKTKRRLPSTSECSVPDVDVQRQALVMVLSGDDIGRALVQQAEWIERSLPPEVTQVGWFNEIPRPDTMTPWTSLARILASPNAGEAAERIALENAQQAAEAHERTINQITRDIDRLENQNEQLSRLPKLNVWGLLAHIVGGPVRAVGMALLLIIILVAYSFVSLTGAVPDGNDVAEWTYNTLFPVMPATDAPPREFVELFVYTLAVQLNGLLIAGALCVRTFSTHWFGNPTKHTLSTIVLVIMAIIVIQPWDLVAGAQFPFTTDYTAYFLIPAMLIGATAVDAAIWGGRKPTLAKIEENNQLIAAYRQSLRDLGAT